MSTPSASEVALREHLSQWLLNPRRQSRIILVRAQPTWSGSRHLQVGAFSVLVVEGVSGLAALDAIRTLDDNEFVVILTALTEAELGVAVVLGAEKQRVQALDEWNLVPALFGSRETVPRPVRDLGPWMPRLLLSLRRDRAFVPATGGVLSADLVVRSAVAALLGLDRPEDLDSSAALAPLDDLAVRARLSDLDSDAQAGLVKTVSTHVDPYLAMAVHAATIRGNVSVVAVGLAVRELWAAGAVAPDATVAAARVRVEKYVGADPSAAAAQRFGSSAKLLIQRWLADGSQHSRDVLEQAEALCGDLGWADGAAESDFLPAGLHSRVSTFAQSIEAVALAPSSRAATRVDVALSAIEAHGAHATFASSLETARMGARLSRWIGGVNEPQPGVNNAILAYLADGAWAERALGDVWDGDSNLDLARAYQSLAHEVQRIRRREDAAAASDLSGALGADASVLPVETLLSELVVPLASTDRVLVVVLDGMSAPTAVELAAELPSRGWTEMVRESTLRRSAALAALPTVTEYSRTSLFAGELLAGNQQTEKSRFAAAVGGIVFHKDDLRAEAGHALPPVVSGAIADTKRKIVGVVLNTIDDALASADVDALRWSLHSVAHLEAILAAAHEAGRVVILTSDHGHVVERGSELRSVAQSSARWRDANTGKTTTEEVLVAGPRVLAPEGRAVLAVSDNLRYASKRAGYHGGGSLAELTIPILVLKPRGAKIPAGWVEAPPQEPSWWNEPARFSEPEPQARPKPKNGARKSAPTPAGSTLFELKTKSLPKTAEAGIGLGESLVVSAIYLSRRGIAGRHPVEDSIANMIVTALDAGGGRAHRDTLAARAGVPSSTLAGLLAALRRVLNVDGYPVIDIDADGVTVVLDSSLLREQFELGEAL